MDLYFLSLNGTCNELQISHQAARSHTQSSCSSSRHTLIRAIMTKRAADGSVVKKENLTWTDHMDNVLVEALVKEDQIGNHVNGTFTSQAYTNMIAVMSKEFSRQTPMLLHLGPKKFQTMISW
ncbi:unnamed protein product [Lactuca saligna]|uniref:Myb/SANT-like domain-containing protein n=1 Tax=Lactuca saligna TaxID=75948 RepID=A0AA35VS98_LACSI|nr:unnamed protein product [Lactuca saligna]